MAVVGEDGVAATSLAEILEFMVVLLYWVCPIACNSQQTIYF